ncbi:MAG: DUF4383 domain-containing protein [Burkholderiales bacterium]
MSTRAFALVFGIVFLLAGVSGFVPAMLHPVPADAPPLTVPMGYGLVMGLLPVNVLHNLVHVLFGILGLVAFGGLLSPRLYAQIVAVAYGLLVILGLLPATNTLFGLVPIYGNDVWLHLVIGVIAAYFGFMASVGDPVQRK